MRPLRLQTALLVVLSSFLQIVIFPVAGPLPLWRSSLAWFALTPLLWSLLPAHRVRSVRDAALLGYACGILWYLGTCYWVYNTMHVYGGLAPAMSLLTLVLFSMYLGLYHAAFAAAVAVMRRAGLPAALLSVPFLWVAVELARARVTSFPWNLLGYSQVDNAVLTALAPHTGVYGLSFVLAAVNAALALVLVLPKRRVAATVALSSAVFAAGVQNAGTWLRSPVRPGTQKAVLLQPNLPVGEGAAEATGPLTLSSVALSAQAAALDAKATRIVLWPESPAPFQTDRPEFTVPVAALARRLQAPVIAGAIGLEPAPGLSRGFRMYNSAVLFTPQGGYTARYDKNHLVPFGEFLPYPKLFAFAGGLTQEVGTFDPGSMHRPLSADGHRYGVFICYESIFGDEVRNFARQGAEVLANLSDDAWYGDSSAPFQHLNMARMRAIENHRWILRDTDDGVTASIDPAGRVVETMQRHQRGAIAVHFDYLSGTTFYTEHGDVFAYACTLLALGLLGYAVAGASRSTRPGR